MRNRRSSMAMLLGCVLALLLFGVWKNWQAHTVEGVKVVMVEVVHSGGERREFTYETDEAYLGPLLEAQGLISGTESALGLFVDTVDGETADFSADGSWWRLTVDGQDAETGVDSVVLENGGAYGWIYTAG